MNRRFHSILALWMLGFVVLLAGCGRELQQRQAFISFLQKEVIPRNSGILIPNKTMRNKFGIYAAHYDVIVEYNKTMLEQVGRPLEKLQREYQDAMKPEATVEERKAAINAYREALQSIEGTLDKILAATESEIAALEQPDELKDVYIQATEKHVRLPAKALKVMIPATEEMMIKNLSLLDFIIANKGKVEIKDGMIQVDRNRDKNQATLTRLNEMQTEILEIAKSIEAQHGELTRLPVGK
jgi:multidrug efflux pump subunit AcrB